METDKKALRKLLLKQRDELSKEECRKLSKIICKNIITLDSYKNADVIFAYSAIRNEISCEFLIEKALEDNKKVALPKVMRSTEESEMQFFYIDEASKLEKGFMGICEPDDDYANLAIPSEKTLIILPGVAFDRNFSRIGYGKGFYDLYLSMYGENSKSIAVCYDFQLFNTIPSDDHDMPADAIVTPTQMLIRNDLS